MSLAEFGHASPHFHRAHSLLRQVKRQALRRFGLVEETPDELSARRIQARQYARAIAETDRRRAAESATSQWTAETEDYAEQFFMMHRGDAKARLEVVRLADELRRAEADTHRLTEQLNALRAKASGVA